MIKYPPQRSIEKLMRLDKIVKYGKRHSFTIQDVCEVLNVAKNTAEHYIKVLRKENQIYIHKYKRTGGSMTNIYKTGDKPDAIKPSPMTRYEYDRRYKNKLTHARSRVKVTIQRDIAAAWIN